MTETPRDAPLSDEDRRRMREFAATNPEPVYVYRPRPTGPAASSASPTETPREQRCTCGKWVPNPDCPAHGRSASGTPREPNALLHVVDGQEPHYFIPGRSADDFEGDPGDPRWCNVCGEGRSASLRDADEGTSQAASHRPTDAERGPIMKRDEETQTEYAIRVVREEGYERGVADERARVVALLEATREQSRGGIAEFGLATAVKAVSASPGVTP